MVSDPRRLRPIILALTAALLAGCATVRSVPPLTSLDGRSCHARPELKTALVLPLDSGKPVKTELDTGAPCLAAEGTGAKSVYAAIRLPRSEEPYLLSVTSVPLGTTLFSPRLMILDAQGALLREVPRESFVFRGSALHAGVRARPGDEYLVVASDPGSVGQLSTRITGSTQLTAVPVGTGVFMMSTGSEAQTAHMFAHNGSIEVSAQPWPKAN
jgi:hypothetical protein